MVTGVVATLAAVAVFRASDRRAKDQVSSTGPPAPDDSPRPTARITPVAACEREA